MKRVVVTGIGVVSCLGNNQEEVYQSLLNSKSGISFSEEYNIERKFRETRLYRIAPVSTNMILAFISHKVLGMPRSYWKIIY